MGDAIIVDPKTGNPADGNATDKTGTKAEDGDNKSLTMEDLVKMGATEARVKQMLDQAGNAAVKANLKKQKKDADEKAATKAEDAAAAKRKSDREKLEGAERKSADLAEKELELNKRIVTENARILQADINIALKSAGVNLEDIPSGVTFDSIETAEAFGRKFAKNNVPPIVNPEGSQSAKKLTNDEQIIKNSRDKMEKKFTWLKKPTTKKT